MRHRVRLTESDLRNLISKSVNRILNEAEYRGVNLGGLDTNTWGGSRIDDLMDNQGWDTARVQKVVDNANRRLGNKSNRQPIANYRNAKNESILRTIVRESVKRILKENEEYDWDEFEADPEGTKDLENDISWNIKDIGDRKGMADTMPEELMWDEKNDMYPSHDDIGFFKDDLEQYDNGYDSIYGDRDVSDEYYGDSDYRFTYDEWNDDDPLMNIDRAYEPTSDLNRRYNESKIRRIVRESLRRASRRRR